MHSFKTDQRKMFVWKMELFWLVWFFFLEICFDKFYSLWFPVKCRLFKWLTHTHTRTHRGTEFIFLNIRNSVLYFFLFLIWKFATRIGDRRAPNTSNDSFAICPNKSGSFYTQSFGGFIAAIFQWANRPNIWALELFYSTSVNTLPNGTEVVAFIYDSEIDKRSLLIPLCRCSRTPKHNAYSFNSIRID